jgi:hypothetical protein
MGLNMEDEIDIEFKRFSKEKQEQIRQLVAYTTLMGLTGKDLVSIGGKLERMKEAEERKRRLAIVRTYPVIENYDNSQIAFDVIVNNINYRIIIGRSYYYSVEVKIVNKKTSKSLKCSINRSFSWGRLSTRFLSTIYDILWEHYEGILRLP